LAGAAAAAPQLAGSDSKWMAAERSLAEALVDVMQLPSVQGPAQQNMLVRCTARVTALVTKLAAREVMDVEARHLLSCMEVSANPCGPQTTCQADCRTVFRNELGVRASSSTVAVSVTVWLCLTAPQQPGNGWRFCKFVQPQQMAHTVTMNSSRLCAWCAWCAYMCLRVMRFKWHAHNIYILLPGQFVCGCTNSRTSACLGSLQSVGHFAASHVALPSSKSVATAMC
jgi:hypothetical protein